MVCTSRTGCCTGGLGVSDFLGLLAARLVRGFFSSVIKVLLLGHGRYCMGSMGDPPSAWEQKGGHPWASDQEIVSLASLFELFAQPDWLDATTRPGLIRVGRIAILGRYLAPFS